MIELILALLAGLLLLSDQLRSVSTLAALTHKLKPFATVIGVLALVVGLLNLLSLMGLLLLLGGWALAADALAAVPAVGGALRSGGRSLRRVGWLLGLLLIVVVVLALLGLLSAGGPPFSPPGR